jgi:hypothetical protein
MTLLALYFLATLDGAFCGFRAFAGRSALIHKRKYYRRAMLRGAISAQVVSFLSLGVLLVAVALSSQRSELRGDLEAAAGRMLWIFLPYAAAVLFPLSLRALPSTDIRAATSVMVLGPLTGLRPFVMIAGVFYGVWSSQLLETKLLGIFILGAMLSLETWLNRVAAQQQQRDLASASC